MRLVARIWDMLRYRWRRLRKRRLWDRRWGSPDFDPDWARRGIAPELREAVTGGWFAPGEPLLDVGCGLGEQAAWLADRGFPVLGVDISRVAVERARAAHPGAAGRLSFTTYDICAGPLEARRFASVLDLGCFHGVHDGAGYVRSLAAMTGPGARLLLFVKDVDAAAAPTLVEDVRRAFAAAFTLDRSAATSIDRFHGADAARRIPGVVFWLIRL